MEFIVLAVFFAIMWALFVLPQQRRMRAQRAFVDSLKVGDRVVTTAGVFGVICQLDDATAELEIADGVVVTVARGAIGRSQDDFIAGRADDTGDREPDEPTQHDDPTDSSRVTDDD